MRIQGQRFKGLKNEVVVTVEAGGRGWASSGVVWYHRLIAGGAGRGYRGSRYRLPHAYSQTKDHMAMASVRMHGRRKTETPRQHRAVQRPTQQRVRERVSVEGEGWGWGEEGETETATEGEDEGEGGGRVWSVECGG